MYNRIMPRQASITNFCDSKTEKDPVIMNIIQTPVHCIAS